MTSSKFRNKKKKTNKKTLILVQLVFSNSIITHINSLYSSLLLRSIWHKSYESGLNKNLWPFS